LRRNPDLDALTVESHLRKNVATGVNGHADQRQRERQV